METDRVKQRQIETEVFTIYVGGLVIHWTNMEGGGSFGSLAVIITALLFALKINVIFKKPHKGFVWGIGS